MILIAQYLLVGLVVTFMLEHLIRSTYNEVTNGERYFMVILWPIMLLAFIIYFIKGLLD